MTLPQVDGRVVMLIGPIASGKSTHVKLLAHTGYVVVNDDGIYETVHAGDYSLWEEELKPLYKSVEDQMLRMGLALGRNVAIDRPNVSRAGRARVLGIASSLDVSVTALLMRFETPEIHARRRTASNARGISYEGWLGAAQRQFAKYQPPSMDEGFDKIIEAI